MFYAPEDDAARIADAEKRACELLASSVNVGTPLNYQRFSTSPIKVFTVCVDQMNGKYMAFLGSDPAKKAIADSRLEAVATLLAAQKLIVITEID